jgi:hypothetical protein
MKHVRRHRHVLILSYDVLIWCEIRYTVNQIVLQSGHILRSLCSLTRFGTQSSSRGIISALAYELLELRLHLSTFLNVPPDPFALGRYLWHNPIFEDALFRHKLVCCFVLGSVGFCRCFYLCSMRRIALRVPDPFHPSIGSFVVRRLSRRCLIRSKILYGCSFEALQLPVGVPSDPVTLRYRLCV